MTNDRLIFKGKETGDIYVCIRNVNTSLTRQIISMKNFGFEYLGPVIYCDTDSVHYFKEEEE